MKPRNYLLYVTVSLFLFTKCFMCFADNNTPQLVLLTTYKVQNVLFKNDIRHIQLNGIIQFKPTQDQICGNYQFGSYCHTHCESSYVFKVGKYEIDGEFERGDTGVKLALCANVS